MDGQDPGKWEVAVMMPQPPVLPGPIQGLTLHSEAQIINALVLASDAPRPLPCTVPTQVNHPHPSPHLKFHFQGNHLRRTYDLPGTRGAGGQWWHSP